MNWIEVIHVRSADKEIDRLMQIVRKLASEICHNNKCHEVKLYRRAHLTSDVCLHIFHNSKKPKDTGSSIGLHLAESLKPFGMINHTAWLETDYTELKR